MRRAPARALKKNFGQSPSAAVENYTLLLMFTPQLWKRPTCPPARACVCRKRRPFDLVEESRSVGQDGRAALLPFEAVGFAVQTDRPA
jgi:hypothetical protein